jgi:Uma2 family endonuclease
LGLPQTLPVFTPDEYLAFERGTDARHEYLDGHVYAMAGESLEHSRICVNLSGELRAQLKGRPCEVLSANMKVVANVESLFAYPDLSVVCGEPRFHDERKDVLVNPIAIFEVLSPSTEAYDRGEKFLRYRTQISTLQEYILVSQEKPMVEHFTRQTDGTWVSVVVSGLSENLYLASIECRLALEEIYSRVVFPTPDASQSPN